MRMAERQAKVAQELAIADRIREAEEVAIEEYYDNSLDINAKVGVSESGVNFGAGGKKGVVSKRIYRFSRKSASTEENV